MSQHSKACFEQMQSGATCSCDASEVEYPEWYRWHSLTKRFGIECKHVAQEFEYNLGAALKYIWRAGRKGSSSKVKDLKKAVEYLKNEIRREEEKGRSTDLFPPPTT